MACAGSSPSMHGHSEASGPGVSIPSLVHKRDKAELACGHTSRCAPVLSSVSPRENLSLRSLAITTWHGSCSVLCPTLTQSQLLTSRTFPTPGCMHTPRSATFDTLGLTPRTQHEDLAAWASGPPPSKVSPLPLPASSPEPQHPRLTMPCGEAARAIAEWQG